MRTCKQKEGKTIQSFTERLVPTTAAIPDADNRRDRLCDLFLDKISEDISFLVRLTGNNSDYDTAKSKALEIENMLNNKKSSSKTATTLQVQAIDQQQPEQKQSVRQFPNGKFNNWTPKPPVNNNNNFNRFRRPFNRSNFRSNQNSQFSQNPQFTPYCTYCKRPGHTFSQCRSRKSQFPPQNNFRRPWNSNSNSNGQRRVFTIDNPNLINKQQSESATGEHSVNELMSLLKTKLNTNTSQYHDTNTDTLNTLTLNKNSESQVISESDKQVDPKPSGSYSTSDWESGTDKSSFIHKSVKSILLAICFTLMIFSVVFAPTALALSPAHVPKHPMICQTHLPPTI